MHRVTRPLARFLEVESTAGLFLLAATFVAFALSNSPVSSAWSAFWELPVGLHLGSVDVTRSLRDWINDGLMTLFFFLVALELKRELVHGELHDFRTLSFSLAGALGGMVVPASIYLALMHGEPGAQGWGIVMATDTAFLIGSLSILRGRVPPSLRLFLLSLVIFDDVGAIVVVAVAYGEAPNWVALGMAGVLVALMLGVRRVGIRSISVYFVLGAGIWVALDASGVHPTLAGVVLGLMTPATEWVSDQRLHAILDRVLAYPAGRHWSGDTKDRADLRRAGVAAREAISAVERLEILVHPWSAFLIMPLFALANAGVRVSWTGASQPVAIAIFFALVVGKPGGVLALGWLATRLRLATRPRGLNWTLIAAGSLLTGIGFTMSIFIAGLTFGPGASGPAKIGILAASVLSSAGGISALAWVTSARRRARSADRAPSGEAPTGPPASSAPPGDRDPPWN